MTFHEEGRQGVVLVVVRGAKAALEDSEEVLVGV